MFLEYFSGLGKVNNVEELEDFDGLHIKNDEIIPSQDNFVCKIVLHYCP